MRVLDLLVLVSFAVGCETIKPYEKEFLLNPAMDDARIAPLAPSLMVSASNGFEKLGSGAPGSGGGTSCPTCGG